MRHEFHRLFPVQASNAPRRFGAARSGQAQIDPDQVGPPGSKGLDAFDAILVHGHAESRVAEQVLERSRAFARIFHDQNSLLGLARRQAG